MTWTEKHRPTDFGSIQGNTSALEDIREWIENWSDGDSPQYLVGPAGTGKTSTAYVTADHADLPLNEIDTSTARRKEDIEEMALAVRSGEQLVFLDEVDSWSTRASLSPLEEALKDPSNPVILSANEDWKVPEGLKRPAEKHEFKLSVSSRRAKIKEIAEREGVPLDEEDLERLSARPGLRSAINDLQLAAEMGVPIGEDDREWEDSPFAILDEIIQHGKADIGDLTPPKAVMWLDQNIPKEYRGLEYAAAADALSRADKYLGKVTDTDYSPWRYTAVLAERVGPLKLAEPYQGWIRWESPNWFKEKTRVHDEESPEAALFRELDISGSFSYFLRASLQVLLKMDRETKHRLVTEEGLSLAAAEALGVEEHEYENLTVMEAPEPGEELAKPTGDALEGDW